MRTSLRVLAQKRQHEQTGQSELRRVLKLFKAYVHPGVPQLRLWAIGSAETVPPGQIEAKVTVCFAGNDRMMDPMHIRCHHEQPEPSVYCFGKPDVAMIELGCCIQCHLKDNNRQRRRPDEGHCHHFDTDGNDDLDRGDAVLQIVPPDQDRCGAFGGDARVSGGNGTAHAE